MSLSSEVMRELPKLCLIIATLALESVLGSGLCERGKSWWDRERNACVPCTHCDPHRRLAVKYPCQLHRDAICQSLQEIRIWPFNTPKRNGTGASEVYSDYEYADYDMNVKVSDQDGDPGWTWDLHTSTLALAASGCAVFFVVLLTLSFYHARQWKMLKRALHSDVQDLSAKLRLMEAGAEANAEPVASTDHHIYCNIHLGKDVLLGSSPKKGFGNVYTATQEKHPS